MDHLGYPDAVVGKDLLAADRLDVMMVGMGPPGRQGPLVLPDLVGQQQVFPRQTPEAIDEEAATHRLEIGLQRGREKVFSDYRIRIAQVIHEQRPGQPVWRPERRTPYNDPARRPPTYVIASESKNADLPVATHWRRDSFQSMYRDGYFAHLVDLPDHRSGMEFGAQLFADPTTEYFRIFEVMRDYGMYDRAEAPQYYPPVNAD